MIPDEILLQVSKPARYIGGEINMVKKDTKNIDIRFAFCFPDVYEVGMSNVGLQILYYFLNKRDDTYCERVFAPWLDMEEVMRQKKYPLFSLETFEPIANFDFIGFTLQYEMSYSNIINMLDLGNIPIFSEERQEEHPIICAGGPCAYNPEPLADIIDFFYIGEGEVMLNQILDIYKDNKLKGGSRNDFLEKLLGVEGVYVPKFYRVEYKENGIIDSFTAINDKAPSKINKVIAVDLDKAFYPSKQLVPLIETVHRRAVIEIFRGCIRGCRFCQAGYIYRPTRERSSQTLICQSSDLIKNTGYEELSLVSLSTSDYTEFKEVTEGLLDNFANDKVNLSLPSLRIDSMSVDLMKKVQKVRKSSLTFAPEAGTQRLRDVINKGISEDEILNGAKLAFKEGFCKVKLYFMIGLPTETEDDILGISKLSSDIVEEYYELPKEDRTQPVNVTVSTSCFVPKSFTPFQWEPQNSYNNFMDKQRLLKKNITSKRIRYNYHDALLSCIEGAIARGDRRVGKAIFKAWELGARFDGWSEHFKYEIWVQAFESVGLSIDFYTNRKRELTENLPWDHISIGVSKKFLINELLKSKEETITPNCREECYKCGAKAFKGGVCFE